MMENKMKALPCKYCGSEPIVNRAPHDIVHCVYEHGTVMTLEHWNRFNSETEVINPVWISVEDRLPEPNQLVLAIHKNSSGYIDHPFIAKYMKPSFTKDLVWIEDMSDAELQEFIDDGQYDPKYYFYNIEAVNQHDEDDPLGPSNVTHWMDIKIPELMKLLKDKK